MQERICDSAEDWSVRAHLHGYLASYFGEGDGSIRCKWQILDGQRPAIIKSPTEVRDAQDDGGVFDTKRT